MSSEQSEHLQARITDLNPEIGEHCQKELQTIPDYFTDASREEISVRFLEDVLWWVSRGREGKQRIERAGVPI